MYRWRVEINFLQITFHMQIAITLVVWLMPLQTGNKGSKRDGCVELNERVADSDVPRRQS